MNNKIIIYQNKGKGNEQYKYSNTISYDEIFVNEFGYPIYYDNDCNLIGKI